MSKTKSKKETKSKRGGGGRRSRNGEKERTGCTRTRKAGYRGSSSNSAPPLGDSGNRDARYTIIHTSVLNNAHPTESGAAEIPTPKHAATNSPRLLFKSLSQNGTPERTDTPRVRTARHKGKKGERKRKTGESMNVERGVVRLGAAR